MSEFKCSECDYSSPFKPNVKSHINKKTKCSTNTPTIITIILEIKCEFCNKLYASRQNLIKHLKVCKVKKTNLEKELNIEKEKVKKLEEELKIQTALAKKPTIGTQNNQFNIILTAYDNPNLKDLEKHLKASVKKIFMAVPTLVEKIHFNEEKPENHNLVIKNARTKLAKVFNGKKWTTVDEEQLLDELVDTYESLLIEYSNENNSMYTEKMNKIKTRDTSEKVYGDMKVEVKKVLYDNRDKIKVKN